MALRRAFICLHYCNIFWFVHNNLLKDVYFFLNHLYVKKYFFIKFSLLEHLLYFTAMVSLSIFLARYVLRLYSDLCLINTRYDWPKIWAPGKVFFKVVRPIMITAFGLVFVGNLLYSMRNKAIIVAGRFVAGFGMGMEGALLGSGFSNRLFFGP